MYNLTAGDISLVPNDARDAKPILVTPSASATVNLTSRRPRFFSSLLVQADDAGKDNSPKRQKSYVIGPATLNYGALKGWALVAGSKKCPWRIYMRRVSRL